MNQDVLRSFGFRINPSRPPIIEASTEPVNLWEWSVFADNLRRSAEYLGGLAQLGIQLQTLRATISMARGSERTLFEIESAMQEVEERITDFIRFYGRTIKREGGT